MYVGYDSYNYSCLLPSLCEDAMHTVLVSAHPPRASLDAAGSLHHGDQPLPCPQFRMNDQREHEPTG